MKIIYFLISLMVIWLFTNQNPCRGQNSSFVIMEGNHFKLEGQNYYPITANYSISVNKVVNGGVTSFNVGPQGWYYGRAYNSSTQQYVFQADYLNANEMQTAMVYDFESLINHGFNSIRLTFGPGEESQRNSSCAEYTPKRYGHCLGFACSTPGRWCDFQPFSSPSGPYDQIYSIYDQVFYAVNQASFNTGKPFKVMILIGAKNMDQDIQPGETISRRDEYANFLSAISDHYKDNPALMAYDFYNEPGNFHWTGIIENSNGEEIGYENYSKQEVCNILSLWSNAVRSNTTHQYSTIGLFGCNDVFQWDPGVMDVDFLSFHIYPDPSLGVRNGSANNPSLPVMIKDVKRQIKWIANTINKPWILGEIGLSSTYNDECLPDQGTNEDQRFFAQSTLAFTRDVGGKGYSWWCYKDADYKSCTDNSGESGYYGLWTMGLSSAMSPCPTNLATATNNNCRYSFEKPAADEFLAFDPLNVNSNGGIVSDADYYNPYNYSTVTNGTVVDQDGNPIVNAVVRGSNTDWKWFTTFTRANGTFSLYSDSPIVHWNASAICATSDNNPGAQNTFHLNKIPDEKTISRAITSDEYIEAINKLFVLNSSISGNGSTGVTCDMKAGKSLIITPGFTAQKGCHYTAHIGNPNCGSLSSQVFATHPNQQLSDSHNMSDENSLKSGQITANQPDIVGSSSLVLSISPNPSNGEFYILTNDLNRMTKSVSVYNSLGVQILNFDSEDQNIKIDLKKYGKGMYNIHVGYCKTEYVQKVIIN